MSKSRKPAKQNDAVNTDDKKKAFKEGGMDNSVKLDKALDSSKEQPPADNKINS